MFESKGVKRNLSAALAVLAAVVPFFPILAPYHEIIVNVAGLLGFVGLGHAAASGTLHR